MSENEIIARGIVAGVAIVLPFLGIAIGRWHSWKGACKFWQMMHKDLDLQNGRLFESLKKAQDFVAEMKIERNFETPKHHKYKRCIGLATICDCKTAYTCGRRLRHNLIWGDRWRKLAEKFRDNEAK